MVIFYIIMVLCGFQNVFMMYVVTFDTYNKPRNSHTYDLFVTDDETVTQKG